MADPGLYIYGGTIVAGAITAVVFKVREWRARQPPPLRVSIALAKDGTFVAVVGKVVSGATLHGPITGRPCVAYDAFVSLGAGGGGPPRFTSRQLRGAPFVIDDGTGTALVDPRGAFVRIPLDHRRVAGSGDTLALHDPSFVPGGGHYERTADEGVIALGALVIVHALVRTDGGADDDTLYRAAEPVRLQLVGGPKRSAVVSTMPADLPDR